VNTNFSEHLQQVCQVLNQHQLEYLTIGGAAVALLGHDRWSVEPSGKASTVVDLDFWYNPGYANYFKLLNALDQLGENVTDYRAEKSPDPKRSFFRLQRPQFTLDFLPVVPGLPRFREAFVARGTTMLGDVEIPFISYEHLIQNKLVLGRLKDMEDIFQLELIWKAQKSKEDGHSQKPH
jgi:hypothetical protein